MSIFHDIIVAMLAIAIRRYVGSFEIFRATGLRAYAISSIYIGSIRWIVNTFRVGFHIDPVDFRIGRNAQRSARTMIRKSRA